MTTFIRHLNSIKFSPRCIDCKYYLISRPSTEDNIYATAKCTRFLYKCSDTGLNKFEYAYIARSSETMCGPSGTKFMPLIRKEN